MSKTILLADDSLTIQKVVELTFMEEDFDVVSVSDGDHALAKLGELTPALVIADVHMPGAQGYEVCRQVKAAHPGVPVLLLVGTFEVFDEEEAKTAGADAHLKKPFDSQELLQMVEGLVGTAADPATEPEPEREEMAAAVATSVPPVPEPMVSEPVEPEPDMGFDISSLRVEPPEVVAEAVAEAEIESVVPEEVSSFAEEMAFVPTEPEPEPEEIEVVAEEVPVAPEPVAPEPVAPEPVAPEPVAPPVVEEPQEAPAPASAAEAVAADPQLSEKDVERIARKVVEYLGEDIVREISWEVIPDLAEIVIKSRLRELEEQVD
jgi:CheY-like chemotaxis protein